MSRFCALRSARRDVPSGTQRSTQALAAIEYLAGHAGPGTDRAIRLVTLVRDRWRNIGDRAQAEECWPGMGSGGPPPDTVSLKRQQPLPAAGQPSRSA